MQQEYSSSLKKDNEMNISIFPLQVIQIARVQYHWYPLCTPLHLQRDCIEFSNIPLLFLISPSNISLFSPICVHFIEVGSYGTYLVMCFFTLGSVFEIHPCWWIKLWCSHAHFSTEFHCANKAQFTSSCWWIFELLTGFCS